MKELHNAYRPSTFEGVYGQDEIVASLEAVVAEERNRAFLFVGPSGTGKTTLARIVANVVEAEVREIDAATNNGIDAMRAIKESIRFSPFGKKKCRMIIVDECHSLSSAAWQSLLKDVEEPPAGVYWAFCTTEAHKVPKTINTRCASYVLRPVESDVLFELLSAVAAEEELEVDEGVLTVCAEKANGSPRQALVNLAKVVDCKTRKEAAKLLQSVEEDEEVIALSRGLAKGLSWEQLMRIVSGFPDGISPEGARRQVFAYFTKVALGSKDKAAISALAVLEAFSTVYPDDSIGHLILSIGEARFGGAQ